MLKINDFNILQYFRLRALALTTTNFVLSDELTHFEPRAHARRHAKKKMVYIC